MIAPVATPFLSGSAGSARSVLAGGARLRPATILSAPRRPQSIAEARAEIDRVEQSIQGFDLKDARHKAGLAVFGTTVACGAIGQLAHALLPASAALGVAATVSIGVASLGMLAVNEIMHGVADKGMLGGAAVMAFFMGFGGASGFSALNPFAAAAIPVGVGALSGVAFGKSLETCHYGVGGRIQEARGLLDKYEAWQRQHADLEAAMAAASSGTAAANG